MQQQPLSPRSLQQGGIPSQSRFNSLGGPASQSPTGIEYKVIHSFIDKSKASTDTSISQSMVTPVSDKQVAPDYINLEEETGDMGGKDEGQYFKNDRWVLVRLKWCNT